MNSALHLKILTIFIKRSHNYLDTNANIPMEPGEPWLMRETEAYFLEKNGSDLLLACPEKAGKGYKRSIKLGSGFNLLIRDYQLEAGLIEQTETYSAKPMQGYSSEMELEFGFHLSGSRRGNCLSSGQSFLQWSPQSLEEGTYEWPARQRVLKADIHLCDPCRLNDLIVGYYTQLPLHVRRIFEGIGKEIYFETGTITPSMQLALHQLLNCPYQGVTKELYLEGKILELIALWLDRLTGDGSQPYLDLQLRETDLIQQAKGILVRHMDNPPSSLELARQVGLNEHKLRAGFRQIFGTTAFGYLHAYRMEQARQLLAETRMTVTEVAAKVGYANQGHFAAAFRKKFGITPRSYAVEERAKDRFWDQGNRFLS